MRVAVYYNNHDVRVEERPKPRIGPGELLVRIEASGICGSDVLEWYRTKKAPIVLGHEAAGEIVEVGAGVRTYRTGQRVFVSHHVPCNTCKYCLDGHHTACHTLHTTNFDPGGFSEFVRVPKLNVERGVLVLPDHVSYEEATLIEPLACVVRGQRAVKIRPDRAVLVIGSGVSGLLHIALAKASGATKIIATDLEDYRLDLARKFGADFVVRANEDVPAYVKKVNDGMLADVVIVCAGALPALEQALKSVDGGGTVLFFATSEPGLNLSLPVSEFWRNALTLVTSYGAAPYDLAEALELISAGRVKVKDLITHRLGLAEAQKGFELVVQAGRSMKVVLKPNQ